MPFYAPSWVPELPSVPDTLSIPDFVLEDENRRIPLAKAKDFFVCGLTGRSYTAVQVKERVHLLARGLAKELGWGVNSGSEWDKVVGVFAPNTVDTNTVGWAAQKLNGICSPANAAYAAFELEHQLKNSGAKCLFTALTNLDVALKVTRKMGMPDSRVFLMELPAAVTGGKSGQGFKTVDDLINQGKSAAPLEPTKWEKGQGGRQCAFLCYSSGTSGLPKGVMISHRNVIANTIQASTFDSVHREKKYGKGFHEHVLGVLPFSHIYGLVVISHTSLNLGDSVCVLPRFEMQSFLEAVQRFKLTKLYLVPPIVIAIANSKAMLEKYDLSSVLGIFCGAAPLGAEVIEKVGKLFPTWDFIQGYGLTETCTVVSSTANFDIWEGSVGSILPGFEVRLVTVEGQEITGYDQPGELWAKSPSVVLGYLNNDKANQETFVDGFMRTGDEAVIRKGPNGHEHVFIVDRIKELIKVKGMQVAPAELEAHLLSHPAVADCCVIAMPDDRAGERPKAFIVKSSNSGGIEDSDKILVRDIKKHVEKEKARHKWLAEVEFIDVIPKSPSGKILRRMLRDKDREARKKKGPKL